MEEGGALQSWCGEPEFGRAGGMVGVEWGKEGRGIGRAGCNK